MAGGFERPHRSVVTVQLGQCGNQVGQALYDALDSHVDATNALNDPLHSCAASVFFAPSPSRDAPMARALLLDMEPKVTSALIGRKTGVLRRSRSPSSRARGVKSSSVPSGSRARGRGRDEKRVAAATSTSGGRVRGVARKSGLVRGTERRRGVGSQKARSRGGRFSRGRHGRGGDMDSGAGSCSGSDDKDIGDEDSDDKDIGDEDDDGGPDGGDGGGDHVVGKAQERRGRRPAASRAWIYDASRALHRQGGSGNNWALGYKHHGSELEGEIVDLLQGTLERCDWGADGILFGMSLAGGTGSGLGARATEAARDLLPRGILAHHTVWPGAAGEVAVQALNAVLTLGSLVEHSDAVISVGNDDLAAICRDGYGIASPGMADLNRVAARQLAAVLLPARTRPPSNGPWPSGDAVARGFFADVVPHLCPSPAHRLLRVHASPQVPDASVPFHADAWSAIHQRWATMALRGSVTESSFPSSTSAASRFPVVASYIASRGVGSSDPANDYTLNVHGARGDPSSALVPWRAADGVMAVHEECKSFSGLQRYCAGLINSASIVPPLESLVERASSMLAVGAYVHHYGKYGVERDDFEEKISTLEQVLHAYSL